MNSEQKHTTETQRTQRLHREISRTRTFEAKPTLEFCCACTHPLPRGGSDCVQARILIFQVLQHFLQTTRTCRTDAALGRPKSLRYFSVRRRFGPVIKQG